MIVPSDAPADHAGALNDDAGALGGDRIARVTISGLGIAATKGRYF